MISKGNISIQHSGAQIARRALGPGAQTALEGVWIRLGAGHDQITIPKNRKEKIAKAAGT